MAKQRYLEEKYQSKDDSKENSKERTIDENATQKRLVRSEIDEILNKYCP